eukprot:NODE_54_length_30443_cov_1.442954.p15 type:complete len:277 gc:universal NODE_54_length_30443_cov_1.442954:15515-16345(+)
MSRENINWSIFEQKESEDNWDKRDKIMRLVAQQTPKLERNQIEYLCSTISSLRTALQLSGLAALKSLVIVHKMDPYHEVLLITLFKVIGGTRKIPSNEANNVAHLIMESVTPNSRILNLLLNASNDKSIDVRTSSTVFLTIFYQQSLENSWLEKSNLLENLVSAALRLTQDASPSVREKAKLLTRLLDTFNPEYKPGVNIPRRDFGRRSAPVTPLSTRLPSLAPSVLSEPSSSLKIPVKRYSQPTLPQLEGTTTNRSNIPSYAEMRRTPTTPTKPL